MSSSRSLVTYLNGDNWRFSENDPIKDSPYPSAAGGARALLESSRFDVKRAGFSFLYEKVFNGPPFALAAESSFAPDRVPIRANGRRYFSAWVEQIVFPTVLSPLAATHLCPDLLPTPNFPSYVV